MPSITSLSTAIALSGTEPLPVDQSGATVKATVNQVKTYVNTTPAITGGSINSTPIGATTPSTGAFTSLTASGNVNTSGSLVFGTANFSYISANTTTANLTFNVSGGVTVGTFTPSGLAVTGNISSSGRTLVGTTTDDGVNALQVNGTAKATSIKFANTGGTKQALDYYEEGTWTPTDTSGAGLTITSSGAKYTRIGRMVFIEAAITIPTNASGVAALISGLPYAAATSYLSGSIMGATANAANVAVISTGLAFYTAPYVSQSANSLVIGTHYIRISYVAA